MKGRYWNSSSKTYSTDEEKRQVFQLGIYRPVHKAVLSTCFQTVCQHKGKIWTISREIYRKEYFVMNQFHWKHAGTKALSIITCYISLYCIKNTCMGKKTKQNKKPRAPDCNYICLCMSLLHRLFCKLSCIFHKRKNIRRLLCITVILRKHSAFLHYDRQFERAQNQSASREHFEKCFCHTNIFSLITRVSKVYHLQWQSYLFASIFVGCTSTANVNVKFWICRSALQTVNKSQMPRMTTTV